MVWSASTTGKGLGPDDVTSLFAKSRFNRKYSTFSWCEDDLALPEVIVLINFNNDVKSVFLLVLISLQVINAGETACDN